MNVADWLRQEGLERYIEAFENNDIDARTLNLLTDTDLVEIGVKSVGHRRKLIEAIAALRASSEASTPPPPPATALEDARASSAQSIAEHRQLTVLYCEMVEPTHSGARLDPEERRELIQRFHKTCTGVVVEYDGHVANFYGDCMLAYFGWPRAHEDDAERAVLAGLVLASRHHASRGGAKVSARVGVATGAVVVGDLIHDGPAREQSAVGLAPNLAARLLGLATSEQVVIDELTRQLLAPSFALQPLGSHTLKGVSGPVAAYAVSGDRPADTRFDAHKGQQVTQMVGREQELALLLERWAQASGGEGQAVLLVGEAGIGKSRVTRALMDACAAQDHGQVRWQCSPYHMGSALWPVVQRLGRAAELDTEDSNDAALDKLEAAIGRDNSEAAALYATLLGLNGTQRYGPLELTPLMLRERTLELLAEQLFDLAEERPLLLVVEDAHWIDPSTLELIGRCLERVDSARMLILITSRPDNQPSLGAHPNVTRLSLNRLSRASVEAIVSRLGGNALHAQTLATIVAQTDGVPLFVEELTKAVLETGEAAIPASLHGSLMARLDRIPEVKEVAQIAACIGREFDQALLQAVAERPEAVGEALDKLVAAELIFRRGDRANPKFTFKHALVQEAARESLLRNRRQQLHERILGVLETERADTPPEILAHHAERARLADKAIAYWQQAGEAALAKSAYAEAASYLDSAVELIAVQTDGVDRRTRELDLQLRIGQAHIAGQGFAADATKKAYTRADELLDSDPARASRGLEVHYGLWAWYAMRGHLGAALLRANHALAAAKVEGRDEPQLFAHRIAATSHLMMGRLDKAREHLDQAMSLHDPAKAGHLVAQFGVDPRVGVHCFLAWTLCIQGFADQGKQVLQRARDIAATLSQVTAKTQLYLTGALCNACVGDVAGARNDARALADLAGTFRLASYGGYANSLLGWVAMESGQTAEAIVDYERGLAQLSAVGARLYSVFFQGGLATALTACGRHEQALRTIDAAIRESDEIAQGWCDAELWRIRGEVLLGAPKRDHAEAFRCFERALTIARTRGTRLWELRAAVSLARLWDQQGERASARDLLTPVYEWFTEGFETRDLVDARTLLNELTV